MKPLHLDRWVTPASRWVLDTAYDAYMRHVHAESAPAYLPEEMTTPRRIPSEIALVIGYRLDNLELWIGNLES